MKKTKQTLSPEQMQHLKKLGVDTSQASMTLLFFDENNNELTWEDIENHGKDKILYEYYDEEKEIWKTAKFVYFDAETSSYDHACNHSCGVFTIQDLLDILPQKIHNDYMDEFLYLNIKTIKGDKIHISYISTKYAVTDSDLLIEEKTLVDALYEMLLLVIKFNI